MLVAVWMLASAENASCQEMKGILNVKLTNFGGVQLPTGRLSIRSNKGEVLYSESVSGSARVELPYGEYTVSFEAEFIQKAERRVSVDHRDGFLVLASEMTSVVLDVPSSPVAITVRASSPDACKAGDMMWAKLIGVFRDYTVERPLKSGMTLFDPIAPGDYVLLILDGERVRSMKVIRTSGPLTSSNPVLDDCL